MTTYIKWLKPDYDLVAQAYLAEVGELLADADRNDTYGMTGSERVTENHIQNLTDILGSKIEFSVIPPDGWES
jgi:hypothetical protein